MESRRFPIPQAYIRTGECLKVLPRKGTITVRNGSGSAKRLAWLLALCGAVVFMAALPAMAQDDAAPAAGTVPEITTAPAASTPAQALNIPVIWWLAPVGSVIALVFAYI